MITTPGRQKLPRHLGSELNSHHGIQGLTSWSHGGGEDVAVDVLAAHVGVEVFGEGVFFRDHA
jgi:hypothetical protein